MNNAVTQSKAIPGIYFFTKKNKANEDSLVMVQHREFHEFSKEEVERLLRILQGWLEWQKQADKKEVHHEKDNSNRI